MPRTVPKKDHFFGLFEKLRQPDITGSVHTVLVENPSVLGAFEITANWANNLAGDVSGSVEFGQNVSFLASRSSSTYGNGSTVQPASLRLLAIIKA